MQTFHFQHLEVYGVAKELVILVQGARISDAEIRDQATRAVKSCFLNLSEGLPSRQLGIRKRHFAIALGSLAEVCAAVDLASALGVIEPQLLPPLEASSKRLARLMQGFTR